ncbi:MAG: hypothetical protein E4H13_11285 [Calditrichales bacterium]|nr:MAG: hypothetical protein E4H13_11285 [Calditrichales bacterium]
MKESIATFILTHEKLATTLRRTVEKIIGHQEHLFAFSNEEADLNELADLIINQQAEIGATRIICFVDLVGGSCWRLGHMIKHKLPHTHVIGGVNIPMLLAYFTADPMLSLEERIEKAVADGIRGIVYAKGVF